jgi:hypothetical protein
MARMIDDGSPLVQRLQDALKERVAKLDNRADPGYSRERHDKVERLGKVETYLASDEAASELHGIAEIEPFGGPLDVEWAIDVAESPEAASGLTTAIAYILDRSPEAWAKFVVEHYRGGATHDMTGDT